MKRLIRIGSREGLLDLGAVNGALRYSLVWKDQAVQEGSVDCVEVEPGIYSLLLNGRSYEVKITPSGKSWAVDVDGRHFVIDALDPRAARAGHGAGAHPGAHRLSSPMPGKVIRVLVEEGAQVQAGQGLVVVEAMKMQNEVKAPRAGRVLSLHTRAGAAVAAGEVLAVLE